MKKRTATAAVAAVALGITLSGCKDAEAPRNIQDDIAKYTYTPDRESRRHTLTPEAVAQPLEGTEASKSPAPKKATPKPTPTRTQAPKAQPSSKAPAPKPKKTDRSPKTSPKAPSQTVISSYVTCPTNPQPCIDKGSITFYQGKLLGGHNYMGHQWLSRVPVGTVVKVTTGPAAGTYKVYGHLRINRQGGAIPSQVWKSDLSLQACEGSGTGFSLMRRL